MTLGRSDFPDAALRYLKPLLNFARSELQAHEALGELPVGAVRPEDVVDAALLEAIDRLDEVAGEGLYPWLRRLVRQVIAREVDAARDRRRDRPILEPVGAPRLDDDSAGPPRRLIDVLPDPASPIPEQVVRSEEFQRALAEVFRQLPEAWREPFLLHVRDDLPLAQVAAIEGISVAETERRIDLARAFLRARLAEEYRDEGFPPPTESLFETLERLEPTREHRSRILGRLGTAA